MNFNLEINTKTRQNLNFNNGFVIKEIQKNRLSEDTIENKITLIFNDIQSYQKNGEPIISADIDSIKITTQDGIIIFERSGLTQEKISLFSNITQEEINLNIIVFDKIN